MKHANQLILYQDMENGDILLDFSEILENQDTRSATYYCPECYRLAHRLLDLASEYGLSGNLWQSYLTFLLVNHENPYSLACEMKGQVTGNLNELALHDFEVFQELFHRDFSHFKGLMPKGVLAVLKDYQAPQNKRSELNPVIQAALEELCKKLTLAGDAETFQAQVTQFYKQFGVGRLGLHKAFRITEAERAEQDRAIQILPVFGTTQVKLDDLVGYEKAKAKLLANTEAFVEGRCANNCLLYGAAGTGKSTSIKAILNQYFAKGLRMIELYKHQYKDLPLVISQVKHRNYRFIVFLDDLSFEDFETEYKYLKAIIEGGLEQKPENVLIYATSNRRHLIRERFSDKGELLDDPHKSDTVQEKLSLAARFGERIYFGAPEAKEYCEIVRILARRQGIKMPEEELLARAKQWELQHGGLSGRTAQQFVDALSGGQRCE